MARLTPAQIIRYKRLAIALAEREGVPVPGGVRLTGVLFTPFRRFLRDLQAHMGWPVTGTLDVATNRRLVEAVGGCPKPPHVVDSVPTHGKASALVFVFHTTEGIASPEAYAAFFRRTPDRLGVRFITDRSGKLAICCARGDKTYHVRSANSFAEGLEQSGFAATTRADWLGKYRAQLQMAAWTYAWWSNEGGIPIRRAFRNGERLHLSGYCGHRDLPGNDHSDPGDGYPYDVVIGWAESWSLTGPPLAVRTALSLRRSLRGIASLFSEPDAPAIPCLVGAADDEPATR